jgi:hypothetical protein
MRIDRRRAVARPGLPCWALTGLLAAALVAPGLAHAQAQLHRWVDEKGVVHWSDRPRPGSEKVEVPAAQGFPAPATPPRPVAAPTAGRGTAAPEAAYTRIEILSPRQDEAIVNTGNTVDVSALLEPALSDGHRTWFVLNGQRLEDVSPAAVSTTLRVDRGSHTLQLQVEDQRGEIVAQSPSVVFHVRQNSIAQPPVGPALQNRPVPLPRPQPRPKG